MSHEAETVTCVFCRILSGELTPEVVAFRDERTAVFPARRQQPHNRGHMLVVPVRHLAQIYDIDGDLAGPLMTTLARVAAAVKKAFAADGVSIRQNNDPAGGQDVFHVHFHVIPRFTDDALPAGDHRSPVTAVEVPLEERVEQARKLAAALELLAANA